MRFQGQCKRGSFTIEATFLMPLIIGILVFVIYMGFYYYNFGACIYTSYMTSMKSVNSLEMWESSQTLKQRTIAMDNPVVEVTKKGASVIVTASGRQKIPFVNKNLTIEACEKQVQFNQRNFILQCRFFEEVLE